jgi:hypothetical protein
VGLVLAASAIAVWRRPLWAAAIIRQYPCLTWPLGRFFWTSLTPFAGVPRLTYSRVPVQRHTEQRHRQRTDLVFTLVGGLVALSCHQRCAGFAVHGLPDANSFNSYFQPLQRPAHCQRRGVGGVIVACSDVWLQVSDGRRPFAGGAWSWGLPSRLLLFWETSGVQ